MSSKKKSFRVPVDAYRSLAEMADERDLSEHKAGIRALERGLHEFGYGDFADGRGWFAELLVETSKALAYMGMAFAVATTAMGSLMVIAAFCLGGAAICLLAERHEPAVKRVLGLPDTPPWVDAEAGGGGQ